jgi:AraC-like DNA-binding protein
MMTPLASLAHAHARVLYRSDRFALADLECRTPVDVTDAPVPAGCRRLVVVRDGYVVRPEAHGRRPAVIDPSRGLLLGAGERLRAGSGAFAATVLDVSAELLDGARATTADVPLSPEALLLLHRARHGDAPRVVEEAALGLVREVLRGARPGRPNGPWRHRAVVEAVKARFAAAPGDAHRLERLARDVGMSPFYLAHVFRAQTGLSLHQYLTRLRLAVALGRVCDGSATLSTIALDVGFSSHSHFTAAFNRHFGAAPSAVRRAAVGRSAVGRSAVGRSAVRRRRAAA